MKSTIYRLLKRKGECNYKQEGCGSSKTEELTAWKEIDLVCYYIPTSAAYITIIYVNAFN